MTRVLVASAELFVLDIVTHLLAVQSFFNSSNFPINMADVEQKPVKKTAVKKTVVKKKPVEEKPVEEKPVEEKPVEEKPVSTQPKVRECVVDLVSYLRVRCLTASRAFMSFAGHRPDVSRRQQERHESSDRPRKSRVELWPLRLLLRGWPLCVE